MLRVGDHQGPRCGLVHLGGYTPTVQSKKAVQKTINIPMEEKNKEFTPYYLKALCKEIKSPLYFFLP